MTLMLADQYTLSKAALQLLVDLSDWIHSRKIPAGWRELPEEMRYALGNHTLMMGRFLRFFSTDLTNPFGSNSAAHLPRGADLLDVLVACEMFPSKSQARKATPGSHVLPLGRSEFFVGRGQSRRMVHLWNPGSP